MHWIEDSLANVNLEALNDILRWTIGLFNIFELDIGSGESAFETTIPLTAFTGPIRALAFSIIIIAVCVKLWITMMSPFDTAEEPGAIAIRGSVAVVGTAWSLRIFEHFEAAFNGVYQKFVAAYKAAAAEYAKTPFGEVAGEAGSGGANKGGIIGRWIGNAWNWITSHLNLDSESVRLHQEQKSSGAVTDTTQAFNLFGGETLIDPSNPDAAAAASLGLLLLELIIGVTLLICFFRLVLEVYERYVLIGVMYITAPLAFASIVSRDGQIFKNWMQMFISQFILMCTNLVFIGGFVGGWYVIIARGLDQGYMYDSYQQYIATNFILIGWLVIGQKLDQHLRGLGLSVAQTGAGLGGAMAAGVVGARALLGAAGAVALAGHKTATGQTMVQKAVQAGRKGEGGGLYGALTPTRSAGVPGSGGSGSNGGGTGGIAGMPTPRTEGSDFNSAVNNAVQSGSKIPAYANNPEAAASFNAGGVEGGFNPTSWNPDVMEGYDPNTNTTLYVGKNDAANMELAKLYGTSSGSNQLDCTSVGEQAMLIHGATGDHRGSSTAAPRETSRNSSKDTVRRRNN